VGGTSQSQLHAGQKMQQQQQQQQEEGGGGGKEEEEMEGGRGGGGGNNWRLATHQGAALKRRGHKQERGAAMQTTNRFHF
jgi:hypothetical protein